jgi:Domain of unknown function (DUF4166)/Saccharopine dehydrogenase NADP binding domain
VVLTRSLKVLIVGGYGTFGGRLVELLEHDSRLTLLVAGRSQNRSRTYCASRKAARATLVAAGFDRTGGVEQQLQRLRPDIVVDASGPFQNYGNRPYRLIEACLCNGISYLDLADGAQFVAGVQVFDSQARDAGVFVLSGVSSFPVLTAAVARRLCSDLAVVNSIRGGIAPSPYAGVGENVIRAIASYAGQKITLRRNGGNLSAYPFTESRRYTIAPPGKLPLRRLRFSLVDVPDLHVLTELWPTVGTIWMGAAPAPASLHRVLSLLAWLVRLKIVRSLLPLAPFMSYVTNHVRWGEHRGGMFVEVDGENSRGEAVTRSWHLLAEGDDGPLIPSMAAQAIIQHCLDGESPPPGARSAIRELNLSDYEKLFAGRSLFTGLRESKPPSHARLYARIFGSGWSLLPAPITQIHGVPSSSTFEGRATVERGPGILARLAATIFGFPAASADVRVAVRFDLRGATELWTRTFGDRSFSSLQSEGRGASERLLCERFGPLKFSMALVPATDRLHLVLRRWSLCGVPLPLWAGPRSTAFETGEGGRFHFHVEIGHPLTGLIVRYRGWLVAADCAPPV